MLCISSQQTKMIMMNRKTITINLNEWQTQINYCRENNVNTATLGWWIKRTKLNQGIIRIEFLDIPELNLTLVKRKVPGDNDRTVTIDLSIWQKQADYVKDNGLIQQAFNKMIFRTRNNIGKKKVDFWDIPELNVTLVKREQPNL